MVRGRAWPTRRPGEAYAPLLYGTINHACMTKSAHMSLLKLGTGAQLRDELLDSFISATSVMLARPAQIYAGARPADGSANSDAI